MPFIVRSSSSSVVVYFVLATGLLTKIVATCASGGPMQSAPHVHPGPQAVQHGVHVMMSVKGLVCACTYYYIMKPREAYSALLYT